MHRDSRGFFSEREGKPRGTNSRGDKREKALAGFIPRSPGTVKLDLECLEKKILHQKIASFDKIVSLI